MRCKMQLWKIEDTNNGHAKQLTFHTQYSNTPEDNAFNKATPSGHLTLMVDNLPAIAGMQEGDSFYLDFTKA